MRFQPLTILFLLAGCIMFFSHRYFAVEKPQRRVRKAHGHNPALHAQNAQRQTLVEEMSDVFKPIEHVAEAWRGVDNTDSEPEPVSTGDEISTDSETEADGEEGEEEEGPRYDSAGDAVDGSDGDGAKTDAAGEAMEGGGDGDEEGETAAGAAATDVDNVVAAATTTPKAAAAAAATTAATSTALVSASGAPYDSSTVAYPTAEVEFQCKPPQHARPTRKLDYLAPPGGGEWPINCGEGREELCEVVKKTAINRQALVAVCNSGIISQLTKWVESNRRAKIENMIIIAIDNQLPDWLEKNKVAYWKRTTSAAGSHKISAQKFGYVKDFLTVGCSVLMTDIDVVYIQNPFPFLHGDADVEGTTDGWDDGSAYGWTERLDDPSMGPTGRFRPSMRITAWNSGLWYISATNAGLRLMAILSHRMATEDTWDQAAFGEEMSRPARDDHLAAGLSKRALNHWCFCNSKTLFRRIRTEARFADHVPVVVHANYHQPKPPRMAAVYDRWHLGQKDALGRFSSEQGFTVPAPELEKDFMHMINDGFVSGANLRDASAALTKAGGCKPMPSKHGLTVQLHTRPKAPCASGDALCAAAEAIAAKSPSSSGGRSSHGELVVVIGGEAQVEEVRLLLASAKRASIDNLLLVLTDAKALTALGADAPPQSGNGPRTLLRPVAPVGELGATMSAAIRRYELVGELLTLGFGVLSAAPPTVFLSNPFASLYRDADIEAMSSGWDDGSAYGYNHVLDDPSMGFTRFCHGSRIVSYEPGFFFAMPTDEAIALTVRMATQLKTRAAATDGSAKAAEVGLTVTGKLSASSTAAEVLEAEREAFVHELWLPSHHEYASVGAILRVMNYMCFVNSKVMFRNLRSSPFARSPVAVQINYHSDTLPRMKAVVAKYLDGNADDLRALPLADSNAMKQATTEVGCGRGGRNGDGSTKLGEQLIAHSPYAWGGVGDMKFTEGGVLETPWGKGEWGLHPDDPSGMTVYADFVGAKHNVRFDLSTGMGVSTRCSDSNVVLVRSIKAAKEKPK